MDASAEQIVLDYLRVLGEAAQRKLRPDERQTFLAHTRVAIARQISETRVAEPRDVQRLLRRFGDPHKLAAEERRRLDGSPPARAAEPRADRTGPADPAGSADTAGPAGQTVSADHTGPADCTEVAHRAGPADPVGPADTAGPADRAVSADRAGSAGGARTVAAAPVLHRPMTARWRPGTDLAGPPRPVAPVLRTLSRWPDVPRWGPRRDEEPGPAGAAGPAPPRDWLDGLYAMVRRHPVECAALAVLGVGGLVDPFPLWMLGSLAVLVSRLWDTRDKLIAVAVPMAVALLGAIMLAGLSARATSLAGYAHGMHTDGWDIIRAGAVLGTGYLAWRMRQGPRPRPGPPWQHIPRGGPPRTTLHG